MGFLDFFKNMKVVKKFSQWREFGSYSANFTAFGADVYKSDVVRSCIRPLAAHTSKANAICTDKQIQKVLNINPNMYMNGPAFLSKVRTRLEQQNTAFVFIRRNDAGRANGFYPVPYASFEALEYGNGLFIKFNFNNGFESLVLPWEDLAVLRKDYNKSDIAGDDNSAVLPMLELINTSTQGVANAVRSTANLRGILKSTKAMLSDDDIKKQRDKFVANFMGLENEGGIASIDATQEFTPLKMEPTIADWETLKEFRENIQRYYGVSEAIITSDYTEAQMEAFYDARIEPFLVDLSIELTKKVFTENERARGSAITYESNRIQYASNTTKLALVALVDRGAMTPNEWRAIFNMAPVDGGDVPIRRLDTAVVDEQKTEETEKEPNESEEN